MLETFRDVDPEAEQRDGRHATNSVHREGTIDASVSCNPHNGCNMSIKISVDIEPDHVCVRCTGRFLPGDYEQTVRTVVDSVLIYDKPRVLVDASRVLGTISDSDYVRGPAYLVEEAQRRAPDSIERLAFVSAARQADPRRRGEHIANSSGIQTRVFVDTNEALTWLLDR